MQIKIQLTCHFNNVTSDIELFELTQNSHGKPSRKKKKNQKNRPTLIKKKKYNKHLIQRTYKASEKKRNKIEIKFELIVRVHVPNKIADR